MKEYYFKSIHSSKYKSVVIIENASLAHIFSIDSIILKTNLAELCLTVLAFFKATITSHSLTAMTLRSNEYRNEVVVMLLLNIISHTLLMLSCINNHLLGLPSDSIFAVMRLHVVKIRVHVDIL